MFAARRRSYGQEVALGRDITDTVHAQRPQGFDLPLVDDLESAGGKGMGHPTQIEIYKQAYPQIIQGNKVESIGGHRAQYTASNLFYFFSTRPADIMSSSG